MTNSGSVPVVLNYTKPALASCTFTNSESETWLTVSPLAALFPPSAQSMAVTITLNPDPRPEDTYHGLVSVNHNLYNAPGWCMPI